jgi:hypothetical protein
MNNNLKPNYLFLYKNNSALDRFKELFSLNEEAPLSVNYHNSKNGSIEFEHFKFTTIKLTNIKNGTLKGFRVFGITIEKELFESLPTETVKHCLLPLFVLYPIFKNNITIF